jgi:hypothetical protein
VIREELSRLFTIGERHRRLFARLVIAFGLSVVVFAVCTVLIWVFESGQKGGNIHGFGDAAFFCPVQLLTVSSSMTNPVTSVGKIIDVGLEAWAIFVVTAVAGSFATFFSSGDASLSALLRSWSLPVAPIPDVSLDGGPAAGDGCAATCTKIPASSRPERVSANEFANETGRNIRDVGDARRMAYNPEMYSRKRATIAPSSSTRERAGSPARRRCCQRRGAYSGAQAVLILVMVYRSPGPYVPLRIAASCLVLRLFVPYIAARSIAEIEQLLSNHY